MSDTIVSRPLMGIYIALVFSGCLSRASYCTGGPSPNAKQNLYNISQPQVEHKGDYKSTGKLFTAHHTEGNTSFPIIHLYGTPYEMGYAQGSLLKTQCLGMWTAFWAFLVKGAGGEDVVEKMISPVQRDSERFTPPHFFEELRGLSDATGYNYTRLLWLHLYPETAGGHCSMFGAWGNATASSYGGQLLQMRALDYITEDFLSSNHALIVYHPSEGNDFGVIGFVGTVSAVTGFSSGPVSLSQIGVSNPDSTFGPQRNGKGTPFVFLLRDLLQFQSSLSDVQSAILGANRTLDLILGFGVSESVVKGDPHVKTPFLGVQYSADHARFYDDTDMLPVNSTWHKPITNVVYHGMDWDCPAWTGLLGDKLREYWGNVTVEDTIRDINPIVQTGNLHIAIYQPDKGTVFISHSASSELVEKFGAPKFAYERPFMKFDTKALLEEPRPE